MQPLKLFLFGPLRLEQNSETIPLRRRKAQALLAYLAMTEQPHSRDALATLLWPDRDQSSARTNLRRELAALRKAVGADRLVDDRISVQLQASAFVLDIHQFQHHLAQAEQCNHPPTETCATCLPHLSAAVDCYSDDFLAGFALPDAPDFDEWQFFQAENLRQSLTHILARLVHGLQATDQFDAAIPHARRWLSLDPLHEPIYPVLMRLYEQTNQRSAALRLYQICIDTLMEELGIAPDAEITALAEAIRQRGGEVGERIAGSYLLDQREENLLGRGGMGSVYRGLDIQTRQHVAIKILNPDLVNRNPKVVERFRREGEALRQLNHPNIVQMLATAENAGQHYLIIEYVSGGSLKDRLEAEGVLPLTQVIDLSLGLADALTRTHQLNIIHRDLKPDNVLLAEDGTPRLTDFGVAHVENGTPLTQTGLILGTVDYLSPEACEGETLDARSDIWSLAIMMLEMLTGRRLFSTDTTVGTLTAIVTKPVPDIEQTYPDIPTPLAQLLTQMLQKASSERLRSMRLVGAALESIKEGGGLDQVRLIRPPLEPTPSPRRSTTTKRYQALEIRIFKQDPDSAYPVEIRIPGERDYPTTHLRLDEARLLSLSNNVAAYGRYLGEALFAETQAFAEALAVLQAQEKGVQIQLRLDAEELQTLAWERLHYRHNEQWLPITQNSNTPFSRRVPDQEWQPLSPISERPIRMLVIMASPDNLDYYGLDQIDQRERQSLHRGLDALPEMAITYQESNTAQSPTMANLQETLRQGFHFVYFLCHGAQTKRGGVLYLEDEGGDVALVNTDQVITLFAAQAHPPYLCFFAACETAAQGKHDAFLALGPALVANGNVPAAVAMREKVSLKTAHRFTRYFFEQVLAHGQIDLAMNEARAMVQDNWDWSVPILFTYLPDGQLLAVDKPPDEGELTLQTAVKTPGTAVHSQAETQQQIESLPAPFQAPTQIAHFVGRDDIVAQIDDILHQDNHNQIIGLSGAGGIGKTALAINLAHQLRDHFEDGVLWTQLNITTPEAALQSFGAAIGQSEAVAEAPDLPSKASLVRQVMAEKHLLLILDNAEDSQHIKHLILNGPRNVVLITTRNRKLLTNLGAATVDVTPFDPDESVDLLKAFISQERINAEPAEVQHLIKLVGGLPLAINIVAGTLAEGDDLTLAEYNDLLQDEQTRLENLADWEDTSKDVAASFELSYQRLPEASQALFATLSVFDGPDFDVQAVAAVTQHPLARVKLTLGRLKTLSLVEAGFAKREGLTLTEKVARGRYRLHPLLKLFADQKLGADVDQAQQRAAAYYAELAWENRRDGYAVLDFEWENIVSALRWAYENQQWQTLLQGIHGLTQPTLGVIGFMDARGHWSEAREILRWALVAIDALNDPPLKATPLTNLGAFTLKQADFEVAEAYLQESLTILENSPSGMSTSFQWAHVCDVMSRLVMQTDRQAALNWLDRGVAELEGHETAISRPEMGYLHIQRSGILGRLGNFEGAIAAAEQGLASLPDTPTPAKVGGLMNLSNAFGFIGESEKCISYLHGAITLAQQLGDYRHLATLWLNLGTEEVYRGQYQESLTAYQGALQLYQRLGNVDLTGLVHSSLGWLYLKLGDDSAARKHLLIALDLAETHHLLEPEAVARINLAQAYIHQGQIAEATVELSRAQDLCIQLDLKSEMSEVLRLQAEAVLAQTDYQTALTYIDRSLAVAEEIGVTLEEGVSWRVKGDVLYAAGVVEETRIAYETSLTLLADQDPHEYARSQLAMAQCLLKQHLAEIVEAHSLAIEALATFKTLSAKRDLAQAQATLEHIDTVQADNK